MGFLDKAKQQATQLAQKAQEGVKTAKRFHFQVQVQAAGGTQLARRLSARSLYEEDGVGPRERRRPRSEVVG